MEGFGKQTFHTQKNGAVLDLRDLGSDAFQCRSSFPCTVYMIKLVFTFFLRDTS